MTDLLNGKRFLISHAANDSRFGGYEGGKKAAKLPSFSLGNEEKHPKCSYSLPSALADGFE